jgi:hypothetical protein
MHIMKWREVKGKVLRNGGKTVRSGGKIFSVPVCGVPPGGCHRSRGGDDDDNSNNNNNLVPSTMMIPPIAVTVAWQLR